MTGRESLIEDRDNGQPYRIEVVVIGNKDEAMGLAAAIANAVDFRHVGPIIVQPCVTLTSEEALGG